MKPSREELAQRYLEDGVSSDRLAQEYGVSRTSVKRWLRGYEIAMRPPGRGLANRGITAPSADELRDLIQRLSYREIAALYGVDFTAVPHWLEAHGIAKPTVWESRRRGKPVTLPDEAALRSKLNDGAPLASIARDYAVDRGTIRKLCADFGINVNSSGWPTSYLCADGHTVRSYPEKLVDEWFSSRMIEHEGEPRYPWGHRYRADFRVGDVFIEVWGVTHSTEYDERRRLKEARCRAEGLTLVGIDAADFTSGAWASVLQDVFARVA